MTKIILDLCGGTGAWSKPYADAGYDVRVLTLPNYDVRSLETLRLCRSLKPYGILAAPPCTMFSLARSTGGKRDLPGAMEVVNACLKIIQLCLFDAYDRGEYSSLKFWAMENPKGYLQKLIGRPAFEFSPWQYGDPYFKKTQLWGYFNEPKPAKGLRPIPPIGFDKLRWGNPKKPSEYAHLKLSRADIRAITPPKFAKAFMEANK